MASATQLSQAPGKLAVSSAGRVVPPATGTTLVADAQITLIEVLSLGETTPVRSQSELMPKVVATATDGSAGVGKPPADSRPSNGTVPVSTRPTTSPADGASESATHPSDSRTRTATILADGRTLTATVPREFRTGGTYVVEMSPPNESGRVIIRPVPDRPDMPVAVATAVIRSAGKPNDLPHQLPALRAELARLAAPPGRVPATPVQAAVARVEAALHSLFPAPDHAPTPAEIRTHVVDGGTQYEAKLARAAEAGLPLTADAPDVARDLKGSLLHLIRTVAAKPSVAVEDQPLVPVPVSREAVAGIEARQAVNAIADAVGGPLVFQVPVPDGNELRTARIAVEPEDDGTAGEPGKGGNFRVLIHLQLTDLGETWIDAGVGTGRVRAVMYVTKDAGRAEARASLKDLNASLSGDGFGEVLLDVRPATDLPAARRRRAAAMAAGVPESRSVFDVKV